MFVSVTQFSQINGSGNSISSKKSPIMMSFSFTEAYLCGFKLQKFLSDKKHIFAQKNTKVLTDGKSILSKCVSDTGYYPAQFDAKKACLNELFQQMDTQLEILMNNRNIL